MMKENPENRPADPPIWLVTNARVELVRCVAMAMICFRGSVQLCFRAEDIIDVGVLIHKKEAELRAFNS